MEATSESRLRPELKTILDEQKGLSSSGKKELLNLYALQKKNALMAYLFLVVLGVFSVHLFYLARTKEGLFRLFGLHFLGLLVAGVGNVAQTETPTTLQIGLVVAFLMPLVGCLGDLVRLPSMVRRANLLLMRQLTATPTPPNQEHRA